MMHASRVVVVVFIVVCKVKYLIINMVRNKVNYIQDKTSTSLKLKIGKNKGLKTNNMWNIRKT